MKKHKYSISKKNDEIIYNGRVGNINSNINDKKNIIASPIQQRKNYIKQNKNSNNKKSNKKTSSFPIKSKNYIFFKNNNKKK